MTIPNWPTELPSPMVDGYSLEFGETRRFATEDAGPPRIGRKYSQAAKSLSMAIAVDRDGRAVFENFYKYDTKEGALTFLMPDVGTDGLAVLSDDGYPLVDDNGTQLLLSETWLCLFGTNLPQYTPYGLGWQVSFSISVMPS